MRNTIVIALLLSLVAAGTVKFPQNFTFDSKWSSKMKGPTLPQKVVKVKSKFGLKDLVLTPQGIFVATMNGGKQLVGTYHKQGKVAHLKFNSDSADYLVILIRNQAQTKLKKPVYLGLVAFQKATVNLETRKFHMRIVSKGSFDGGPLNSAIKIKTVIKGS